MSIDLFRTRDYKIAAYLLASGLDLHSYNKFGREVIFEFSPKEKAEKLLHEYLTDTAKVSPKQLFYKLNDLKTIIFNEMGVSAA